MNLTLPHPGRAPLFPYRDQPHHYEDINYNVILNGSPKKKNQIAYRLLFLCIWLFAGMNNV